MWKVGMLRKKQKGFNLCSKKKKKCSFPAKETLCWERAEFDHFILFCFFSWAAVWALGHSGVCLQGGRDGGAVAALRVFGNTWECSGGCFALCRPAQFAKNILANGEGQRKLLAAGPYPGRLAGLLCRRSLGCAPCAEPRCPPALLLWSHRAPVLLHSSVCTDTCVAVSGFLWSLKAWSWVLVGELSVSLVLICVVLNQCRTTVGTGCL